MSLISRAHHREVHRCGDEASWWSNASVDPIASARALWLQTSCAHSAGNVSVEGVGVLAAVSPVCITNHRARPRQTDAEIICRSKTATGPFSAPKRADPESVGTETI